jgi:hypothetical protein
MSVDRSTHAASFVKLRTILLPSFVSLELLTHDLANVRTVVLLCTREVVLLTTLECMMGSGLLTTLAS